ncbi:ABC transporter ATP-binding protein, partial [Vibrio sp. Vb0932]|nr:ABC transporter ATP-binding protein [Vibrio alginolyticus]MDW2089741.1 ABC transporter ATP-binding protein [Vibrio sp. 2134-1]MDW3189384.1 ABC transporter ATP-binding protein [Vibrio sp. Vb0932]
FVIDLTKRIVNEFDLTVMMVTHSMKDALACGDRTVMLHQGEIVLDVAGEQRANMQVPDLLDMFSKVRGEELSDDSLLLN